MKLAERIPGFKAAQRSMKHKLGLYMVGLAVILIAAVCIGLFLFGRLRSPGDDMARTLQTQMDFFYDDMSSLWRNVATSGVHLSEEMADIIDDELSLRATDISALTGDIETLTKLEDAMMKPLCSYIRQTRCSGAFVVLDAAMRADADDDVRSGLYIQKNNAERMGNELLLFRGMAGVGKAHDVMPHRKWQQEFKTDQFPGYSVGSMGRSAVSPWSPCRITEAITLPGTSERAMLLIVPIKGADGTVYGVCGFAVNQTYFGAYYEQPSDFERLACAITVDTGGNVEAGEGLVTYTRGGACNLPSAALLAEEKGNGLIEFSGAGASYIGRTRTFAPVGDNETHRLSVMIPEDDYNSAVLGGVVQTALFGFLLLFFTVACCTYFTKRYLKPVYEDIKRLQAQDRGGKEIAFDEVRSISDSLMQQDREHLEHITTLEDENQDLQSRYSQTCTELESAQADAKQLASRRKSELEPGDFEMFLAEYNKFTDKQKLVMQDMVTGLSPQESADHLGHRKSTIYSYRRDIYERLKIQGKDKLHQLRLRAALLHQEDDDSESAQYILNGDKYD